MRKYLTRQLAHSYLMALITVSRSEVELPTQVFFDVLRLVVAVAIRAVLHSLLEERYHS